MKNLIIFITIVFLLGCSKSDRILSHEWIVAIEYFNGDKDTILIEHDVMTRGGCGLFLRTSKSQTFGVAGVPACLCVADGFYKLDKVCSVRRYEIIEHNTQ